MNVLCVYSFDPSPAKGAAIAVAFVVLWIVVSRRPNRCGNCGRCWSCGRQR